MRVHHQNVTNTHHTVNETGEFQNRKLNTNDNYMVGQLITHCTQLLCSAAPLSHHVYKFQLTVDIIPYISNFKRASRWRNQNGLFVHISQELCIIEIMPSNRAMKNRNDLERFIKIIANTIIKFLIISNRFDLLTEFFSSDLILKMKLYVNYLCSGKCWTIKNEIVVKLPFLDWKLKHTCPPSHF